MVRKILVLFAIYAVACVICACIDLLISSRFGEPTFLLTSLCFLVGLIPLIPFSWPILAGLDYLIMKLFPNWKFWNPDSVECAVVADRDQLTKPTTHEPDIDALTAYGVLGLPSNAEASAIRSAFRRLSKKYHPDVAGTHELQQEQAHADFIKLRRAYELLSDPKARKQYHAWLMDMKGELPLNVAYERIIEQRDFVVQDEASLADRNNVPESKTTDEEFLATERAAGAQEQSATKICLACGEPIDHLLRYMICPRCGENLTN